MALHELATNAVKYGALSNGSGRAKSALAQRSRLSPGSGQLLTLSEKGVAFKVTDDPSIDTTSRTGKLVMGILALIAEFENDIRRGRQMDGIAKARERGVKFGRKRELTPERIAEIKALRKAGAAVPEIIRHTGLKKASIYRALAAA